MRALVVLCALLLPAPAFAELRVMAYGDSLTAVGDVLHPEDSYPGQLQRLRPDLEVVNEGRSGDVSDDFDRFRQALAEHQPRFVVLMLGTNDAVCDPDYTASCAAATATPEASVANLFRMAEEARRAGAGVLILTPPPAVCTERCQAEHEAAFTMAVRHAFTERLAEDLLAAHPPAGVRVANLRGKFTDASWEALSVDGLHPSAEGSRVIAEFVAARIPKRQTASEPRPPRDELDPFVRRPRGGTQ